MTAIWMGFTTVANELSAERLSLIGEPPLRESMQRSLGLSPFANGDHPQDLHRKSEPDQR
jgi:hypothetical protein